MSKNEQKEIDPTFYDRADAHIRLANRLSKRHRSAWGSTTMGTACRYLLATGVFEIGIASCDADRPQSEGPNSNASNMVQNTENKVTKSNDDPNGEFLKSETGTAMATPKPGTANIQGKVFYNLEPVENIDVRLCVE